MKELLARVPYWKALALVLAGGASLLWLQSSIKAAIDENTAAESTVWATKSELHTVDIRLTRIEEKIDQLLRRK